MKPFKAPTHRHRAISFMPCKSTDATGDVVRRWIVGICECGAHRVKNVWK